MANHNVNDLNIQLEILNSEIGIGTVFGPKMKYQRDMVTNKPMNYLMLKYKTALLII